jgi:biotin transporter BioY
VFEDVIAKAPVLQIILMVSQLSSAAPSAWALADPSYPLRCARPRSTLFLCSTSLRTPMATLVQILNLAVLAFELPVLPSMRGKTTSVQGTGWIWGRVGAYFVIGFIACEFRALL